MQKLQQIKKGKEDTMLRNWIKIAPKNSIVVMHNHPRNGMFSGADLKSFADYIGIKYKCSIKRRD